jgi:hypothetical protein
MPKHLAYEFTSGRKAVLARYNPQRWHRNVASLGMAANGLQVAFLVSQRASYLGLKMFPSGNMEAAFYPF